MTDRLDLDTGCVRTFTSLEGLAGGYVTDLRTDGHGQLWVATRTGLTRLDPQLEPKPDPPSPLFFTRVQEAGEAMRLPGRKPRETPPLWPGPSNHDLQIEPVGTSFRNHDPDRSQGRLEDRDADGSPPSDQRSFSFAWLAPWSHRSCGRATTAEGDAGAEPATLTFQIVPPFGQGRWLGWAVALVLAVLLESLHRLRHRRRLELEAIRTRIATDLHDDIGSNLSRLAILSEVASRGLDGGNPAVKNRLEQIASVSRDLVDSMSDIVWAVNPSRDRLLDLVRRMRHFADDVLSSRDIELRFGAPADGDEVPLGSDTRREVFLVFKEAVNNVARHSGARHVEIELGVDDGWLALEVADDGHGFDPARTAEAGNGDGLLSMKRRADNLGGAFEVISSPREGTTLTLRVPLGRRGWAGRLERAIFFSRP